MSYKIRRKKTDVCFILTYATFYYSMTKTNPGNLMGSTGFGRQEEQNMIRSDVMQCFRDGDVFYRCWLPNHARAVLIFLHGAGEHSGHYTDLAPVCRQHGLVYVTPDLRGFGQSGGQRGHIRQFDDYLHDLHLLVRRIQRWFPELPLFLAGHSLGALIVIRYIQQFDDPVRGSIVSAPAFGLPFRFSSLLHKLVHVTSLFKPTLTVNAAWLAKHLRLPWLRAAFPDPDGVLRDPFCTYHYTTGWLKEMLHNGAEALAHALQVAIPTLCIYFERDPIVNVAFIRQFFDTIRSDQKACIVLPDCGHNLWCHPEKPYMIQQMMHWIDTLIPDSNDETLRPVAMPSHPTSDQLLTP